MSSIDAFDVVGVINLYALAVDTQQWDLFDRAFTPDIEADFGGGAEWKDLVSFKRDFALIHSPFSSTQHVTTNHVVKVNGTTAHSMSYVHGRFVRDVPGGNYFESTGWYDDQFLRTDEGWRIKRRICRMTWWNGNIRVLQTMEGMKIEHHLDTLSAEAQAGRLAALRAIKGSG